MYLKTFQHSFAESPNLDQFPVIIQSARSFMQIGLSKVYSITEKDTLSPRAETKENANKYSQRTCAHGHYVAYCL